MEAALELDLTDIQMQRLNQVQMYLGVMWVSELCTADGKRIRIHISKDQKHEEEHAPTLTKPYQLNPNTASRKILDRVVQSITKSNEFTIRDEYSLGTWTENHSKLGNWQAYTNTDRNTIWMRIGNST